MSASDPVQLPNEVRDLGSGIDGLMPLVYDELRQLAANHLRNELRGNTLQTTALAHEVYLKLVSHTRVVWNGPGHVMAIAAALIRRILVDHARTKSARKRGDGRLHVTLSGIEMATAGPSFDVLDLDDILTELKLCSPRQAQVVELKFFGGLTNQEIADALHISETLVKNEWRFARAWLASKLGDDHVP